MAMQTTEQTAKKYKLWVVLSVLVITRELAAKHGWEIREVYRDEGYSGS